VVLMILTKIWEFIVKRQMCPLRDICEFYNKNSDICNSHFEAMRRCSSLQYKERGDRF